MNPMNRRTALMLGAASAAVPPLLAQSPQPPIALPEAGKVRPRPSASITSSPLSVGMETLDRKMFEPEKALPYVARLGVKWARVQTGWARTERQKGVYDFTWLDQMVDGLLKIGVQPWFNLGYGNPLYTPGSPHETAVGYVPMNSPEAKAAWVAYVGRLAEHFRTRVRHWEIWNEVNIKGFWRPLDPTPQAYAEFMNLTAPVIRKRIKGAVVVGFALAGFGPQIDFVKGALDAGIAKHIDKLSYHPYELIPEANYADQVRTMRRLLAKYKPGIALWQGENGAPSKIKGAGHVFEVDGTETGQAKWLLRRIMTDLSLGIELTSYFHCVDLANYIWAAGPTTETQKMGLLTAEYKPKESYFAYQTLCALFDAQSRREDLMALFRRIPPAGYKGRQLQLEGVWRATFLRNGRPVYAYWWPGDLSKSAPLDDVLASFWPDAEWPDPVLVDPLRSTVHTIRTTKRGGFVDVPRLPLRDYPLIVTDRSVVSA